MLLLLVQMMFPFPFVLFVKALFTTLSIAGWWITGTLWSRLIWDVYRFIGIMSNLGNNCPKSRFIGIPQRKHVISLLVTMASQLKKQYEKTQQILPIYKKFFRTYPTTPKEWVGFHLYHYILTFIVKRCHPSITDTVVYFSPSSTGPQNLHF